MKKENLLLILLFGLSPNLFSQKVVFSEDFDGGIPSSWTASPVSSNDPLETKNVLWNWVTNEGNPNNNFWIDFYHLRSPTADNGFAIFDGAYLDAGPNSYLGRRGIASGPFVSDLISPVIDCSELETVAISFHQELYSNSVTCYIGVSKDGGRTWEFLPINESLSSGFSRGTKDYNAVQTINLTEYAAGEPDFRFCFRYDGSYFYWLIDDVVLSEIPEYDLAISDVRYPLTSYAQPASQFNGDTLRFGMSLSNLGLDDQKDVILKYSILDTSGQVYFADSTIKSSILSDLKNIPFEFSSYFIPQNFTPGHYLVKYEAYVEGQEDFTPTSNVAEMAFEVTESLFAKSYGSYFGAVDWGAGDGSFKMGNLYHTSKNADIELKATKAITAIDRGNSNSFSNNLPVKLYEIKPEVGPDWSGFDLNSDNSLILRGIGEHTFINETIADKVEITLLDIETLEEGVALNPGSRYILLLEFLGENSGLAMQLNNKFRYEPESTIAWGSGFNAWLIGSAGGFPTSNFGFVPIMDMVVESLQTTKVRQKQLPVSSLMLSPNPANHQLTIELSFEEPVEANLFIMDALGRVIWNMDFNNLLKERIQLPVSDMENGLYFMKVETQGGGYLVKRFTVQR